MGKKKSIAKAVSKTVNKTVRKAVNKFKQVGKRTKKFTRSRGKQSGTMRMGYDPMHWNKSLLSHGPDVIADKFPVRREKIQDIVVPNTAVNNTVYYINPGNSALFPVFSTIAACYEGYKINRLRFIFKSRAYAASGSVVAAGTVCMATSYDPDNPIFLNMTEAENYIGNDNDAPYTTFVHDVVSSRKKHTHLNVVNSYYTSYSNNQSAPTGTAAKFYDYGVFNFIESGVQPGTIGELHVEYSFTMLRPKQPEVLNAPSVYSHYTENPASSVTVGTNPFGTSSMVQKVGSSIPVTNAGNSLLFSQAGIYYINYSAEVTTATGVSLGALGANVTALNIMADNTSNQIGAAASGVFNFTFIISVSTSGTGAANKVAITTSGTGSTGSMDLWIFTMPQGVTKPHLNGLKDHAQSICYNKWKKLIIEEDCKGIDVLDENEVKDDYESPLHVEEEDCPPQIPNISQVMVLPKPALTRYSKRTSVAS